MKYLLAGPAVLALSIGAGVMLAWLFYAIDLFMADR